MRIVHIVARDFRSVDDGGRIKTGALATALAACGELHVLDIGKYPMNTGGGGSFPLPFGGEAHYHALMQGAATWHVPSWMVRGSSVLRRLAANRMVRHLGPDIVVADDITCARIALGCGVAKTVVHTHNVESVLHRHIAAHSGKRRFHRKAMAYEHLEREVLTRASQIWAVSQPDADYYRGIGCAEVRITPNVVPASAFPPGIVVGEPGRALYFGSLWWGPNVDAARDYADIARRMFDRGKRYRFMLAGRGACRALLTEIESAQGLEYLGFLPSLREEAQRAAAIVIPLGWGGGTKIKTLEALALGKPVITTPEGAVGLDLVDGRHALIREIGLDFDRAVMEVLDRPDAFVGLAAAGQNHVRERFSCHAITGVVRGVLDKLAGAPNAGTGA